MERPTFDNNDVMDICFKTDISRDQSNTEIDLDRRNFWLENRALLQEVGSSYSMVRRNVNRA